ncbi:MAG: hypothetical protein H6729_11255 [Deltaproteobacteria bacterium]|nr:hypothetical protein [Deltaproteobacteria bacterium]
MADLKALLLDLERALSSNDLGQIASVRRTIVEGHPESEAGAEASYRLGLDALFIRRDLKEAEDYFRRATKAKSPTWSPSARMSLGSVLLHAGKIQQAIFELRRVASVSPPTILSVQAKGLLALAFHKNRQPKESERVRDECKTSLRAMSDVSPLTPDGALAAWMLGMELKFDGDRLGARACLKKALDAQLLPADAKASAERALKSL